VDLTCRHSHLIEVRRTDNRGKGGRGVFAVGAIAAGELIERVPVLLIPKNQVFGPDPIARRAARISWYVFDWVGVTKRDYVALALGYGSIYNHSPNANARYEREAPDVLSFIAVRDIAGGEEITINYRGQPDDPTSPGFEVKG
jgi:uncharacterized protein